MRLKLESKMNLEGSDSDRVESSNPRLDFRSRVNSSRFMHSSDTYHQARRKID